MKLTIHRLQLDREGMECFVGSLEAQILHYFWEMPKGEYGGRTVARHFMPKLAYMTIITTLNRMAAKGYINRRYPTRGRSLYSAAYTEDDFIDACITSTFESLRNSYPDSFAERIYAYAETFQLSPDRIKAPSILERRS